MSETVLVVVDEVSAGRLMAYVKRGAVWVVDSAGNRNEVERIRAEEGSKASLTLFKSGATTKPDERAAAILRQVDLHHGEYSQAEPYSRIEVYGCGLSSTLLSAIQALEFDVEEEGGSSFVVALRRPAC